MKYTVTVTQAEIVGQALDTAIEIFRQSFDELDLSKVVVALNQKPRGRPAKKAKEVSP